ncbi:phage tail protein [Gottschalkia purinilytica]|uniref:Phage tail protein n=1 Tax=Gottschalkia purinilytica TaxID=1503 RepID=A0A0L0WCU4_GOTPU|nr:phage tail domain-containing protein [Gottschalkia purinilytica]KNF09299.1 phage tail protein [Gottschalkia purinilytica]
MLTLNKIKITNSKGDSIVIDDYSNYRLVSFNPTGVQAEIQRAKIYNGDGSKHIKTVLSDGPMPLIFRIMYMDSDYARKEELLHQVYRVFNPGFNPITVECMRKDKYFSATAVIEQSPFFYEEYEHSNKLFQTALVEITNIDSYWKGREIKKDIAVWVSNTEFPLEIPVGGIELGYREKSTIINVYNDGDKKIGMTIEFKATGDVKNPSLLNIDTQERIKINKDLVKGDILKIYTQEGNKKIELIRNGLVENASNYIDLRTSTYIQLDVGDNLFRYEAEEKQDNLEVSVYYSPVFLGVI